MIYPPLQGRHPPKDLLFIWGRVVDLQSTDYDSGLGLLKGLNLDGNNFLGKSFWLFVLILFLGGGGGGGREGREQKTTSASINVKVKQKY